MAGPEASKVGSQVIAGGVGRGVLGVGLQELGEVEDLETVVGGLRANVGVVANDLDVAPGGGDGLGRQAADVGQAAIGVDLGEGSAVSLAQESELTAGGGISPAY